MVDFFYFDRLKFWQKRGKVDLTILSLSIFEVNYNLVIKVFFNIRKNKEILIFLFKILLWKHHPGR